MPWSSVHGDHGQWCCLPLVLAAYRLSDHRKGMSHGQRYVGLMELGAVFRCQPCVQVGRLGTTVGHRWWRLYRWRVILSCITFGAALVLVCWHAVWVAMPSAVGARMDGAGEQGAGTTAGAAIMDGHALSVGHERCP